MKCPFCNEPRRGESPAGVRYACGTVGPDGNDEYTTGHTCDIHQWSKVLREKDAEIERLRATMRAVASMPGSDWLMAKIALGQALGGFSTTRKRGKRRCKHKRVDLDEIMR